MSCVNTWVSHVTYMVQVWVTSRMNECWHIWISHVTYEWITNSWKNHVAFKHMSETCHIYGTGVSLVTYEWVLAHMNKSCMSHKNELCHPYKNLVACKYISESCHIHVTGVSHVTYQWMLARMNTQATWTRLPSVIQGGEVSYDALRCRSFATKEPLSIGLFCAKLPIKIRHPMTLRHPVEPVSRETAIPTTIFCQKL